MRHPKIEVHRAAVGKPLLHPNDPHILGFVGDTRPASLTLPFAHLDDVEAVAELVDELARPWP